MSLQPADPIPLADARRLTERIRLTAHSARENLSRLRDLIDEAQQGQVHVTLGYASWTAYIADVFGEEPLRLPRDQRQELVGYLAGEGMSTRAIAPIVGVDQKTVSRDAARVRQMPQVGSPDHQANASRTLSRTQTPADTLPPHAPAVEVVTATNGTAVEAGPNGEVQPAPAPARSVTGLDGKTYDVQPKAPRRRPLVDAMRDVTYDLGKKTEALHRLVTDDRFPQNAEQAALSCLGDLLRHRDLLQKVIEQLTPDTKGTQP